MQSCLYWYQMKTYTVRSRYGHKYQASLVNEDTIQLHFVGSSYVRCGFEDDNPNNNIGFVDPEGGPFISLFETAADVIHEDLPPREIIEISFNPDNQYYIIKLKPSPILKKKAIKTKRNKRKIKS